MLMLPAYVPSSLTTIASVSGGGSSGYALKLVKDQGGPVAAVYADVKGDGYSHYWSKFPELEHLLHERFGGEGRDTTRFIWQLSEALDIPIERLEDGRTIWAVAAQTRAFRLFVNGKFLCKASEALKKEVIARWIEKNYKPGSYRIALGMNVLEPHRVKAAQHYWRNRLGWDVEVYSPIIEHYKATGQNVDNCVIADWANGLGIDMPDAYAEGLPHNNCKDCFMAGQTQFASLYRNRREHYLYSAQKEYELQSVVGIDATILKDERGGTTKPMNLYAFVDRVEAGDVNERESGNTCGCFAYAPMTNFLAQVPIKVVT